MSKTKFEVVEIEDARITVDVSMISAEELWFNATEIAKPFGKMPKDFLKTEPTREYIEEIFKEDSNPIKKLEDLVRVKKGKYGGTWLHRELAFEFAGWCSALFRRHLHRWVEQRMGEERERQRARLEAKTSYPPMTKAIMGAHDEPQFYHFSNEADMINRIVLGMSAKKFKDIHEVSRVRDAMAADQLFWMEKLQRINAGLIEIGMAFNVRKAMLEDHYLDQVQLAA